MKNLIKNLDKKVNFESVIKYRHWSISPMEFLREIDIRLR